MAGLQLKVRTGAAGNRETNHEARELEMVAEGAAIRMPAITEGDLVSEVLLVKTALHDQRGLLVHHFGPAPEHEPENGLLRKLG